MSEKSLPSWYLLTEQDQMVPPDAQRFMAQRAGQPSHRSHQAMCPCYAHPVDVANLIVRVAGSVK